MLSVGVVAMLPRWRCLRWSAAALSACVLVAASGLGAAYSASSGSVTGAPRRITMAFTGDFLATHATWGTAHRYAEGRGYDYRPMLRRLRPLISSVDVAICHLETPLTGPGVSLSDYPRYVVPHQLANAIHEAGYDGCSTASNHSLDAGLPGIRATLGWLDHLGLKHTGTARSARERSWITRYRVGNVVIAHLSHTASFNGIGPAFGWEANRIDTRRIVDEARRARRLGADIVVVSLHWGQEHQHAPTSYQTDVARRLMGSGAIDLIVGHHAHVIQPIRRVAGHWVAYGLGNSLSGMTAQLFSPSVQDGMVLLVSLVGGPHGWHIDRIRYAPTWVEPYRWLVRPVGPALAAGVPSAAILAELRRSWARTVAAVDARRLGVTTFKGSRF
jgi:poly-gamma-glutamate capsule biosynthesis protein CapA/YwtB (metallophosphatase superfamily)